MKAWWHNLSLHNKLQIPTQLILLLMLILVQVWVTRIFEKKLFEGAEQRAISSATQSFLGLNAMMLNGNINQPRARIIYFKKMAGHDGVMDFHLVRGKPVQDQFGIGLPEEQARDELDRKALSSNLVQIQRGSKDRPALRVVVPFAAGHDFHGTDCLQCHHVREGAVNGAVSLTISLEREYTELNNVHLWLSAGQMMLQVALFFLVWLVIRNAIRTVVRLQRTMLAIEMDGDLNKCVEIESGDEVGRIANVFNKFLEYIKELKQQLAAKVIVLEGYQSRNELDQRIASGYMNKLIALDKLQDSAVQFYLKPAENFNGDLIAISRTPDNRLHLLLADSTGHGLSAALAAMPMIHPFYSMTGKGFAISAIAKEINNKVWQVLPVSHFVAAILVSVDVKSQVVEVWSGGCPPPFILNGKGECEHQFKPRHLAMGILPPTRFDASVEYYSYHDDDASLVMFSDGVIELENESGEQFGLQRLINAARADDAATRWQNINRAIGDYSGNKISNNDDIALMMAQFKFLGSKKSAREAMPVPKTQRQGAWQFALTLPMHQIKKLDVVPLLLDIEQQIDKDKEHGGEIFMILSELFNNALEHGLLKLNSGLKQQEDGMEKYFEERAMRLADAETGQIQLHLEKMLNEDGSTFLRIRVKDSGDGFDCQHVGTKIVADTRRYGRGIALLYNLCRKVQFLGNGSEVVVEFDLQDEMEK